MENTIELPCAGRLLQKFPAIGSLRGICLSGERTVKDEVVRILFESNDRTAVAFD
jgi:hypothetical protein